MNPIKAARETLGLTQSQLAKEANLSRLSVLRTEQGLYTFPSQRILKVLSKYGAENPRALEQEYLRWQKEHRGEQRDLLAQHTPKVTFTGASTNDLSLPVAPLEFCAESVNKLHPFAKYIKQLGLSHSEFCKRLCINYESLRRYMKLQRKMPNEIKAALEQAGMSQDNIELLDTDGRRFYRWREKMNGEF